MNQVSDLAYSTGRPSVQRLGAALRELQDAVAATYADDQTANEAAAAIENATELLEASRYRAARDRDFADMLREPGSLVFVPPIGERFVDGDTMTTTVRFGSFYLGRNGVAHGGALLTIFDDVLGKFATQLGDQLCRTAYIRVEYKNLTPLDVDLKLVTRCVNVERRKRIMAGQLFDGDTLVAEAEGLFIHLRDGAA